MHSIIGISFDFQVLIIRSRYHSEIYRDCQVNNLDKDQAPLILGNYSLRRTQELKFLKLTFKELGLRYRSSI